MKNRVCALCLLLALLTACAAPPDAGGDADLGSNFQGLDLRERDLSGSGGVLFAADFDTRTQWPEAPRLPEGFDPAALLELGKDPGLGLRALHARGITGKGVGIAIIDQALLPSHSEYADRLRYYQAYHSAAGEEASMHGPAVASIALGTTVGVAPEALLYYIADDAGIWVGEDFVRDLSYYAEDVDRFLALNETLPEGEKIRVLSMSVGWMEDTPGAAQLEAAIGRARKAGVAVVCVNSRDPLLPWMGMGREPYGDPNDRAACRPGAFWEASLYSGEYTDSDGSFLLVPMDRRTTASPAGEEEYACFAEGGMSWAVPYVAGLYALACQAEPDIGFADFLAAAQATAHPLSIRHGTERFLYGRAVDPAALLDALARRESGPSAAPPQFPPQGA